MQNAPSVSIIVPALNEADNIAALVARVDAALTGKANYEIIFIDDRSTDGTKQAIAAVAKRSSKLQRAIRVYTKIGKPGKAYSLMEGFEHARFESICMIDADLQYPPEAIPQMLAKLGHGYDVVVANRQAADTSLLRRMLSRVGRIVYGKLLYSLDCDVQSGLKLFRSSILDHVVLNSTRWTFDLSFLVQARETGHTIGSVSIPFAERTAGNSKVNVIKVGFEILFEAVKFKLGRRSLEAYVDSINSSEEIA